MTFPLGSLQSDGGAPASRVGGRLHRVPVTASVEPSAPIEHTFRFQAALLIGGVVVTESVFSIPGLGRLTGDAVLARDYPTVQAVILLFSLAYVFINLVIDVLYTLLDPRIRY